jgi:hypothetical protein
MDLRFKGKVMLRNPDISLIVGDQLEEEYRRSSPLVIDCFNSVSELHGCVEKGDQDQGCAVGIHANS